jgi:hypothetical protein
MKTFIKIMQKAFFISLLMLCISCKPKQHVKIEKSFYYWKTSYDFTEQEIAYADTLGLQRMYVRCFDIDWSANAAKPVPVGMMNTSNYMAVPFESVTPCIFITNTVMEKCSNEELEDLAEKIAAKLNDVFNDFAKSYASTTTEKMRDSVNALNKKYSQKLRNEVFNKIDWSEKAMEHDWLLRSNEIQIDCDWTEKTKEKYFFFLKSLKGLVPDKIISCTLRLWQYKNSKKAGVPPVDKCMLMCYSIGSPKNYDGKNSIANAEDLKKYLMKAKYSLPLDIALPIYSWGVLYRKGKFKGILHNADISKIQNDTINFEHQVGSFYKYLTDTVIENTYIRYGDEVKIERVDSTELMNIIDLIDSSVKLQQKTRIAFFSWDTTYIKQYGVKNFDKYYKSFQ